MQTERILTRWQRQTWARRCWKIVVERKIEWDGFWSNEISEEVSPRILRCNLKLIQILEDFKTLALHSLLQSDVHSAALSSFKAILFHREVFHVELMVSTELARLLRVHKFDKQERNSEEQRLRSNFMEVFLLQSFLRNANTWFRGLLLIHLTLLMVSAGIRFFYSKDWANMRCNYNNFPRLKDAFLI